MLQTTSKLLCCWCMLQTQQRHKGIVVAMGSSLCLSCGRCNTPAHNSSSSSSSHLYCTQCTVYDRLPSQFHQLLSTYCAPSTNPLNTGNSSHTIAEASVNRTSNQVSLTTTTTSSTASSTASSNIRYILAFTCSKSRADLLQKQENSSSSSRTNEAPLYRLASDGSTVQLTVQYNFNGGTGKAADVKQVGHTAQGDSVSLAVASGRVLLELKPAHDERQTLKENDAVPAVWSAEARVYRVSVVSSAAAAALVAGQAVERGGQQQQQQQQPGHNHGVASSKGQHSARHKRQRKPPQQQQQQHVAAPAYWKGASTGGLQGCVSLYVFPGRLVSKGTPQEEQQLITELHDLLPELAGSSGSSSSSSSSYCLPAAFDADAYNRCELRLAEVGVLAGPVLCFPSSCCICITPAVKLEPAVA